MDTEEALEKIGSCGKAFLRAILKHPSQKTAFKSLLQYELGAIDYLIQERAMEVERIDILSKTSNTLTQALEAQLSNITRWTDPINSAIDEFSGTSCEGVDILANSIEDAVDFAEQEAAKKLASITGQDEEKIGDLRNQMYEAQKRLTLRKEVNAMTQALEEKKIVLQAFDKAIEYLEENEEE